MTILHKKLQALDILVFLGLMFMIVSCSGQPAGSGVLTGKVTIGPIQPVVTPGTNPPVPPEVFEARKIMVYSKNGKSLLRTVDIEQIDRTSEGRYSVQLESGEYMVDINRAGIDSSSEVPKVVAIGSGQTVVLDIDIDTGIR